MKDQIIGIPWLFVCVYLLASAADVSLDCKTLLCTDIRCDTSGTYAAVDCTCTYCPTVSETTDWKYKCLTRDLKVCTDDLSCLGLCSDSRMKCQDAARYPDSACVCVPCKTAESQQLRCAEKRGFCAAVQNVTPTISTTPATPPTKCTELQVMECRNCTASSQLLHTNGSCRACPHRREADRPGDCEQHQGFQRSTALYIAFSVIGFLVICCLGGFLIYRRVNKKTFMCPCGGKRQAEEGGIECQGCNRPVQNAGSLLAEDCCQCSNGLGRSVVTDQQVARLNEDAELAASQPLMAPSPDEGTTVT